MRIALLITFLLHGFLHVYSQSTAGLTGVRDTSYTILNEFKRNIKNYPYIKEVKELNSNPLSEKRSIVYSRIGKRELVLDVFSAEEKPIGKMTAIIMIHGGGWRGGDRTLHYPLAQRLASLGYVCITPEYRLSTEALYPAAVNDLKSVVQWVRANANAYNIDTSKIVIAGHSAGGELAAFLGATNGMKSFEVKNENSKYSSRVNAVIDIDGILAFIHSESGEGDDSKRISAATHWFGYSKTEKPEIWKQASPLTHVGAHTPPTLFINSSVARMHAGREDFISVLNKHQIYSEVKTFEGSPHSFILFNPWFDSITICVDRFLRKIFPKQKKSSELFLTVAQDGTGDFSTIQSAFDLIPVNNIFPVVIFVKKGIYREKLFLDSTKSWVELMGENKMNTIIRWNDHTGKIAPNGDTINTRTSWTFKVKSDNFNVSNITFENDAGFSAGQAVAFESNGDKAFFTECRFIGNQDVLFLNSDNSRQVFLSCYIEGTTDFIFGSATAWFEQCEIYSKKNSHVTAASTPQTKKWGFVFNNCKLTGDTSLHNVSLGRPWRPYAAVVYMNCYIGSHIKPEGWSNWNNTENYKTTRYAEYKNYGPSSDPAKRVSWSRQLSDEEAKTYTLKEYVAGWYPEKKKVK